MRERIVAITLAIVLTLCCTGSAYAHGSAGEHWQDLRLVLFGDTHYRGQTQKTDDLRIITPMCSRRICSAQGS